MINELENIVIAIGDGIISKETNNNYVQIKTKQGGVINFYPSTGKVTFQGKVDAKERLSNCWERLKEGEISNDVKGVNNDLDGITVNLERKIKLLSDLLADFDEGEIHAFLYRQRENIAKNYSSLFFNESDLKVWFSNNFEKWFDIYSDVEGTANHHGKIIKVEADFIICPKQEIENSGAQGFLGVEVKYINPKNDFCGKSSKMVFQTLSYAYSDIVWDIKQIDQQVKTEAFLVFTNLSFSPEKKSLFRACDRFYDIYWKAMLSVANHADVGELMINGYKEYLNSWYMHFSGSNYCSWNRAKGLVLNNKHVIGKRKIGNIG